ncbi:MAG TPA: alanine--tRNA ligase [Firmicutes bacterium]|nr:alanine--tRNA ligase [Bacillota bacterium]
MEWTGLNELREMFLSFFESKGHTRLPSFPLVPQDDASLLLINSGMAPMKKYFLGVKTPPNKRVTTCQKCIRTPDIERVGKTARHGTYFEMLGNFSFGDYFKEEATTWAWEFITQVLKMPTDKLWVTIYENDDEAFKIWTEHRGVPAERVVRLGKEDNFWEIGSGPCGPCSEIYFDRGEKYGCGKPTCGVGCDCDRYVEFWNLVFTQFDGDGKGNYPPLEHPNIDTGMGLERLACIMQGVDNLFEVDTVQRIMQHICKIAGVTYKQDEKTDVSLRVITDHIRSTTMMISDGIVPQNEGRGYVLRRLLRRAARHGRMLGIHEPFLYKVCETVIQENKVAYPELEQHKDYIIKVIRVEEERFARTIDQGIELLSSLIDKLDSTMDGTRKLSGAEAFKLYDTFGFPIDLTKEILDEKGLGVDEEEFSHLMDEQRKRAREARAALGDVSWVEDALAGSKLTNLFTGYQSLTGNAQVQAIMVDGALVDQAGTGDPAALILTETPFYAEMGGQVGDTGLITSDHMVFEVTDTRRSADGLFIHNGVVKSGIVSRGDQVQTAVDASRRADITRNHTACHMLQAALRQVLGDHVHQAGSMVDEHVCRFDFSHFSAMTADELRQVEDIVNSKILEAIDLSTQEMSIDEAKAEGAMALFGEKYGDRVRVVSVGDFSKELCGGCHVSNSAKVGLFKIVKESSVAAGIRRIEAVTGKGVMDYIRQDDHLLADAAATLKLSNPAELPAKVAVLSGDLKAKDREIANLNQRLADINMRRALQDARQVGSLRLVSATFNDAKADALRSMGDMARANHPNIVAILCGIADGKASISVSCGKDAVAAGAHAGKLVKELTSLVGGSGGGRPDSAMGGTSEIFRVDEALAQAPVILEKMITK